MPILFANNAASTLAASLEPWHATLRVAEGDGARFPAPDTARGEYFLATLADAANNMEIVRVTSRDGDTMQIERGHEDTSARSFTAGDRIELRLTGGGLEAFAQAETLAPAVASELKSARFAAADLSIEDHGDPAAFGSLAHTLAKIGSGRATVVLPGGHTFKVNRDLTVPEGVNLVFLGGAVLEVAYGKTLTLEGAVDAPPCRIFAGDGIVTGKAAGRPVLPQWWGAKGDGATDDTSALSAALKFPRVHLPAGTYLVSSPMPLRPHTRVTGEGDGDAFTDWENDFEQFTPSFAGRATILQYQKGGHGALFAGADHVSFEGIAFRCGEGHTPEDAFFASPGSHVTFTRCRFENFEKIMSGNLAAFGALRASNCRFLACTRPFSGTLTDCIFRGNTFTSCGVCFELTSGAGFNTFSGNRFEWSETAIVNSGGRANVVNGNIFDAHGSCALKLQNACDNQISGNLFVRNGRKGTGAGSRSHIVLQDAARSNLISSNSFIKGTPDNAATPVWPEFIVECLGAGGTCNLFRDNDTVSGCAKWPVEDPYWNSPNALLMDDLHIKGIGEPDTDNDRLIEMLKRIAQTAAAPVNVHLYENRRFTVFTDMVSDRIRLIGHGNPTLTDTPTGQGHSLLSVHNLTYGRSFREAPAQMRAEGPPNQGFWRRGALVWNSRPAPGGDAGWVCTAEGNPGTWKPFATIGS